MFRYGSVILRISSFSVPLVWSQAFPQAFCQSTLLMQHFAEYNYILLGNLNSLHNLMSIERLSWDLSLDCEGVSDLLLLFFSVHESKNAIIHTSSCKNQLMGSDCWREWIEWREKHSWTQDSDSLIRMVSFTAHETWIISCLFHHFS